uniref:uncharacterized protein LOC118544127 isoform X2 n=1 Tax=Halichoerus grypus TaxID=9711 RepID=UPI0016594BC9|nr:uncharacterized protein LOC118544127 isoform X2 [Halichoerus grypus]
MSARTRVRAELGPAFLEGACVPGGGLGPEPTCTAVVCPEASQGLGPSSVTKACGAGKAGLGFDAFDFLLKAILGILCNELPVQAFVAVTQKVAGTRGPSFEACPLHQLVSGSRGLSSTSRPDEKALCLLWQLVETLGAIKGETETVRAPWAGLWRPGEDPLSTGAFLFLFLSYSLVWEISSLCLLKNISTRSHETFLVNLHV